MEKRVKWPSDFPAIECVSHYFERDGKWFWYCVSCHTGSGKRKAHKKGHKTRESAFEATKMHSKEMRIAQQHNQWKAWWYAELLTTDDVEYFAKLWTMEYGTRIDIVDFTKVMKNVQGDSYIRKFAESMNPWLAERRSDGWLKG